MIDLRQALLSAFTSRQNSELTSLVFRLCGVKLSFIVDPPRRKSSNSLSSSFIGPPSPPSTRTRSVESYVWIELLPSRTPVPPFLWLDVDFRPRENDCFEELVGGEMGPAEEYESREERYPEGGLEEYMGPKSEG